MFIIIATHNPRATGAIISVPFLPSVHNTISDLEMTLVKVEIKRGMYHLGIKTAYISVNKSVQTFNIWKINC